MGYNQLSLDLSRIANIVSLSSSHLPEGLSPYTEHKGDKACFNHILSRLPGKAVVCIARDVQSFLKIKTVKF